MDFIQLIISLVATLIFGVVIILILLSKISKTNKRIEALENSINRISETFYGISAGAVGQGEHLAKVEKDLAQLRSRLESVATNDQSSSGHNQAIKLAKKGVPAAQIAEECEITKVEADLIVLLHGTPQ